MRRYREAGAYVDSFGREAWWNRRGLFFGVVEEDWEVFDGRHGEVSTVVAGKEGLDHVS